MELVVRANGQAGNEQLPDSARAALAAGVPARMPLIEIAYHAYPSRVRRPDREPYPGRTVHQARTSAQDLICLHIGAFADSQQVQIAYLGGEGIGISLHIAVAIFL